MAGNGISQANGADLLQRFLQQSWQARAASPQNTAASLKIAKAEAQLSEASVLGRSNAGYLRDIAKHIRLRRIRLI
jgi:hypothetical protein